MTKYDQCEHCVCREDLAKCEATPCDLVHGSWYVQELREQIAARRALTNRDLETIGWLNNQVSQLRRDAGIGDW